MCRREEPESCHGEQRNQAGKSERAPIEAEVVLDKRKALRGQLGEHGDGPGGNQQSESGAEHRQKEALGEQLATEALGAGAEDDTGGYLLVAGLGA